MTMNDWVQAGAVVLAAIIGPLVASRMPSASGTTVSDSPGATVTSGNRHVTKTKISTKTINNVTVNPPVKQPAPDVRPKRQADAQGDDSPWEQILLVLVVAVLVVMAYLRYRTEVNGAVVALQLFALVASFSALITAWLRSVTFGRWTTVQIVGNALMAVLAIVAVRWLSDPPFGDGPALDQLLRDGETASFAQLIEAYGSTTFLFVGYQVLGLVFSILTVCFIVLHSVKVLAATGLIVRRNLDAGYEPGRLRTRLLNAGYGGTTWAFWCAVVTTAMSLLLVSGLGAALVDRVQAPDFPPASPASAALSRGVAPAL
jgi:hypothetical protein